MVATSSLRTRGYFLDMYLCLREIRRVTGKGGKIALVVGNARYGRKPHLVNEFTAEFGERAGLACQEIRFRSDGAATVRNRWGGTGGWRRERVVLFEKRRPMPLQ